MDACDYKYWYRFEIPENLTAEEWIEARSNVADAIYTIMAMKGYGVEDVEALEEDKEHVLITETCTQLGMDAYRRWKR